MRRFISQRIGKPERGLDWLVVSVRYMTLFLQPDVCVWVNVWDYKKEKPKRIASQRSGFSMHCDFILKAEWVLSFWPLHKICTLLLVEQACLIIHEHLSCENRAARWAEKWCPTTQQPQITSTLAPTPQLLISLYHWHRLHTSQITRHSRSVALHSFSSAYP